MRNTTLSVMLLLSLACSPKGDVKSSGAKLYDRLGGKAAIEAVVQKMLDHVKADNRINAKFANADMVGLKSKLVDQICEATGGPCKYTGRNMKEAHAGMGISTAEFDALVEDLVKALDELKVAEREKNELLGILGPMKADIVEEGFQQR
ncbi:MAG: group 1 truncated hemoglobin [Myxococcales bacterium]|nr:group 1 truncated hemoglobin [Myxococcota bacterium]MDW8283378.1 group 1 truncated hemoglobin [Myxococcales bacterium]